MSYKSGLIYGWNVWKRFSIYIAPVGPLVWPQSHENHAYLRGDTADCAPSDKQLVRGTSEGHFTHHFLQNVRTELHMGDAMATDDSVKRALLSRRDELADGGTNPPPWGGSSLQI